MHLAVETILLLVGVAFVAGAFDAVAGGGGLLTVPALLAAGVPPVNAIATNKLQSCCGTGGAFVAFLRSGQIDLRQFLLPVGVAFLGSAAGSAALQVVGSAFLAGVLPLLLIAIALYFLIGPKPGEADAHARLGTIGLGLIGGVIGFYDGFFGPGAGSFFMTALVAFGGFGIVRAIAHTKLLNFATNLASVLVLAIGGKILWVVGGAMAIGSVAGSQVGAKLVLRFGGKGVRPLLVVISLALTAKLLADPANPLWAWLKG